MVRVVLRLRHRAFITLDTLLLRYEYGDRDQMQWGLLRFASIGLTTSDEILEGKVS